MGRKRIIRTTIRQRSWEPELLPLDPLDVDVVRAKRGARRTGDGDPITGAPPDDDRGEGRLG
jgi:hypothetical protein